VTNLGKTAITITSIAVGGTDPADFTETNTCGSSLAANSSCTITVTFTPLAIGTLTANVTITDSDVTSPQKLILTGTGAPANVSYTVLPTSIAFPSENVGLAVDLSASSGYKYRHNEPDREQFCSYAVHGFPVAVRLRSENALASANPNFLHQVCSWAAQAYSGQLSVSIEGISNPSIVT